MRFLPALPVCVAVFLFSSPAFASHCADAGQRELTLYLVNRARLTTNAETILMTEVTEIWRTARVAVQWRPAPSGESQTRKRRRVRHPRARSLLFVKARTAVPVSSGSAPSATPAITGFLPSCGTSGSGARASTFASTRMPRSGR